MIAGVVLAAGASRRFGAADKLLAPFRGAPLAAWAAGAMAGARVDLRIAVVRSGRVAALFPGFRVLRLDGDPGQADSLRAGIAAASGADLAVIALADMPLVDAALIDAVIGAAGLHGLAAAWDGARAMPPAAFAAGRFPALAALTGDRGAGALLADLPAAARVPSPRLADIDTEAALLRLSGAPRGR